VVQVEADGSPVSQFLDEGGKVSRLPIEVSAKDAEPSGGPTFRSNDSRRQQLEPYPFTANHPRGFFCGRSAERITPEVLLTRILPSEYIAH
jgi:hypothetical protein